MMPKYLNLGCEIEFDCEVMKPIISDTLFNGIEQYASFEDFSELRKYFFEKIDLGNSPILTYKTENTNRLYQIRVSNENLIIDEALNSMLEGRIYGEIKDFMPKFFKNFGISPNSLVTYDNAKSVYDSIWILGGIDKYSKNNNFNSKQTLESIALIEETLVKTNVFGDSPHFFSFDKAKEITLPEHFNKGFIANNRKTEFIITENGDICRTPNSKVVYLN
jgi:hypothetical protein